MQARREAMAADLVVVNHHLFFADLSLRDSGVAELLPTVDAAVFDEAHQLVEAGVQFLGTQLATGQLIDIGRDMLAAGLRHARGLLPWADLQARLERAARELRLVAAGPLREVRGVLKLCAGRARRRTAGAAAGSGRRRAGGGRRDGAGGRDRAGISQARTARAHPGAAGRALRAGRAGRPRALGRPDAAAGAAGGVAAGHPRDAHAAAPGVAQELDLHVGDAGRRRRAVVVHVDPRGWKTPSGCASAAPSTTRRTRASGCRRGCLCRTPPTIRRRWARWPGVARWRWAAALSC